MTTTTGRQDYHFIIIIINVIRVYISLIHNVRLRHPTGACAWSYPRPDPPHITLKAPNGSSSSVCSGSGVGLPVLIKH